MLHLLHGFLPVAVHKLDTDTERLEPATMNRLDSEWESESEPRRDSGADFGRT